MYVYREIEKDLEPFLERKEALAIIGPRQAGKSTLLSHMADTLVRKGKRVRSMTFERLPDRTLFENNIDDFLLFTKNDDIVIIDEFQYAKDGGQKLKYAYDTTDTKWIISGSSSLELTFQTATYMVGRMLDFLLLPFSFREFLSWNDPDAFAFVAERFGDLSPFWVTAAHTCGADMTNRLVRALELFVVYGGYPAVALAKTPREKEKLLEGIVEKYLRDDVTGLLHLSTADALMRMTRLLATQIGQLVTFKELSAASGLDYKEMHRHIDILEKTFVVSLLHPFFINKRTELIKNPKAYFVDIGLRNHVLSDFRPVEKRQDAGLLMENYAFTMLARRCQKNTIKFWRTKSKAEVDFVVEDHGTQYPIEVKYTSHRNIGKSMYSFIEKFRPPVAMILTKDVREEIRVGETNVIFVPLCFF